MDTSRSIFQFAKRFFAGTALSRLSGLFREMAMAFCFGSAPEIASFMVAYRFANLFRRLLGEGNLQAGFVPHFESIRGESPKEALLFYRDTIFSLLLILLGIIGSLELLFLLAIPFVGIEWKEILHLAMWMTPGLLFLSFYALNSAFLQCQKSYFLPAVAPVFFNFGWILTAFAVSSLPTSVAIQYLSFGVVISFAMQWLMTSWKVRSHWSQDLTWKEWFRPNLFSPEWKKMLKPLSLGILGIAALQINTVFDAIFSRLADPSGPAYLWYAIRIQQLPLALFGVALSGALLPPLARAIREGALDRYRDLLSGALRQSASLMIFSTFALFALAGLGLNLIYGHGHFSAGNVLETRNCLLGYGVGLIPSVFTLLLASGFYARKSYWVPTMASLGAVLFNLLFNALLVFVFHSTVWWIALGTSLASLLNCVLLALFLRKEVGVIFSSSFWISFMQLLLSGSFGLLVCSFGGFLDPEYPRLVSEQIAQFSMGACLYISSFFFSYYLFNYGIRFVFSRN